MLLSRTLTLIAGFVPAFASQLVDVRSSAALEARQTKPGCTNAQSRLCWDGKFDINTNYYTSGPRTGKKRVYYWELRNTTLSPDGTPRLALAINGTMPGPTLIADWGDTIEVHLKNSLKDNGTSFHWHGIRQFENSKNDGVNGVTECPLAPGDTKVYTFIAEQYGTSWYHSHYSAQYGDGVWGAIVINGPATAEYDIDLGTVTLSEWFRPSTAFEAALAAERTGPPRPQNFLQNGTNAMTEDVTKGKRFKTTFTPGKKHRLRFINTSVDTFFKVSLDGHNMTVIQSDFVPIKPYTTNVIGLAIGQRYDVIIEANQPKASYWLRTWPQISCSANDNDGSVTGYVAYSGVTALPTSAATAFTDSCTDETQLVPQVPITVDSSGFPGNQSTIPVSAPQRVSIDGDMVFRWFINGAMMNIDFNYPTLQQLADGNSTWNPPTNPIFLDKANTFAYWVIQNGSPVAHPIHLHGHDFNIVSSGTGNFSTSTATLKWDNPPRRDVAMLPGNGYLFIAFKTDNPGAWLMHCHIAWHVSEGLSLQLIERQSEIFDHMTLDADWERTCDKFETWYDPATLAYGKKTDSGLRKRRVY
uniref:laccase n=1 Tax=Auricularia auricula-judae TaxID=29892 RepID=A0A059UBJ3_AURAJ|nr:laccase [Auricularia auricula-judae]